MGISPISELLPYGHLTNFNVGTSTMLAPLLCGHIDLPCGHLYCVGTSTMWPPLPCGHLYHVGTSTCTSSIDTSNMWAPLPYGHLTCMGTLPIWLPLLCGHLYHIGTSPINLRSSTVPNMNGRFHHTCGTSP